VQSFKQIAVYHGDVNNQVVLVPKGSAIRSLGDLKGKRVGYVRATTTQYYLIQMLKSAGLSWDDIDPVAMTVSDGAEAFGRGSLTHGRSMVFRSSAPWPHRARGF
jgi:sulfonate transport system substrate-binding protein